MTDRRISFEELAVPVMLRAPGGPSIAATVREATLVRTAGEVSECRVVLELEPDAYETVAGEELLHLEPEVRGPGAAGFAPQGAVRVEARLDAELIEQLVAQADAPRAAGQLLGELSRTDADSPLLSTDAWFATSVTSSVELPAELAGEGTLESGYTTTWASGAGRLELPMLAIVEEILDAHGWEYEELDDETALGWPMRGAAGSWSSFALAREAEERFAVYSVLDVTIPAERRADAAVLIARINWGLPVGNWELDLDDGTLRYKTSIDVAGDRLSLALAERVVARNLEIVDAYLAALSGFADGRLTSDEALSLAEG